MHSPVLIYKSAATVDTCSLIHSHIYIAVQILVGNLIDNKAFANAILCKGKQYNQ